TDTLRHHLTRSLCRRHRVGLLAVDLRADDVRVATSSLTDTTPNSRVCVQVEDGRLVITPA
ncbi:hypothetical protein, partial [Paraburkholderia tropica]|uniref:hypothetical protein n=1 Tax=Paraburkholderia tropica TaxID=92647 RepID=UPI002AAFFBF7